MPRLLPSELRDWSGGAWEGGEPARIDGVSNDSRTIRKDNLYFALKGPNFDGHAFIDEVFLKGAAASVVSREWQGRGTSGKPLLRVADPADALRAAAASYRRKINPLVIAVTGSAGKSTVKEMIAQTLSKSFETSCTRGNWNNDIGLPLSMLGMTESARVGVFEVGMNHPGEITALCRILGPSWGIITNVGPVHIEFFDSIEGIANEKADLLRSLPAGGVSFLNRDMECFNTVRRAAPGETISVSMKNDADYLCRSWNAVRGEAVVVEKRTGESYPFKTKLRGEHNVANAMLAVAVARRHGMAWETIAQALLNYDPLPMRWETRDYRGAKIINDAYNANPLSMRAAIKAFDEENADGGKWLVLSGMLELGAGTEAEHVALGEYAGRLGYRMVAVGELGRLIALGARRTGQRKEFLFECGSNAEAAELLAGSLRSGDAVLLKASRGMKLEEIVQNLEKKKGARQ
ncbi:MAG: hypothetical protein C0404_13640 [Verrucomicrobia bacterium]|nr:hypothetical protein [Verrucomicrobiota bacterium]